MTESLLKLPYSEEELLQGLTPQTAHADELADLSASEIGLAGQLQHRPALVLSSRQYHQQTGLLICCPVSTSIRGAATEGS